MLVFPFSFLRFQAFLREKYLDDLVHADTRLGKNALDVLTAHFGLVGDAAFDQVAFCVGRDLARDEDAGAGDDGLGLGGGVVRALSRERRSKISSSFEIGIETYIRSRSWIERLAIRLNLSTSFALHLRSLAPEASSLQLGR